MSSARIMMIFGLEPANEWADSAAASLGLDAKVAAAAPALIFMKSLRFVIENSFQTQKFRAVKFG
jgi:hypothetical protein